MKNVFKLSVFMLGLLLAPDNYAHAESECGSGSTQSLVNKVVPNTARIFNSACVNHDKCYGSCGRPKTSCDEVFLKDMRAICEGANSKKLCRLAAGVFHVHVLSLGGIAYSKAQSFACRGLPP